MSLGPFLRGPHLRPSVPPSLPQIPILRPTSATFASSAVHLNRCQTRTYAPPLRQFVPRSRIIQRAQKTHFRTEKSHSPHNTTHCYHARPLSFCFSAITHEVLMVRQKGTGSAPRLARNGDECAWQKNSHSPPKSIPAVPVPFFSWDGLRRATWDERRGCVPESKSHRLAERRPAVPVPLFNAAKTGASTTHPTLSDASSGRRGCCRGGRLFRSR